MSKKNSLGLLLSLALVAPACGGGDGPSAPAPVPTPTPAPVTTTLFQDNGPVEAESGGYIDFPIPRAGTLTATVDWTFATSHVVIALTSDACNDALAAFQGQCSNIGAPLLGMIKPKTITGSVNQAGRGRLWIVNLARENESVAVLVTLTSVGGASAGIQHRGLVPAAGEAFRRAFVPVQVPDIPR